MSFSAATCITGLGTQPLGENIEIYSNVDNYTTLVSAVTLTQLTTNCPLILEVPDGSTRLKVFDPETTCFYIIQLQSNDMCAVCDLGFTEFSSSTISRLTVGDLTGSCESSITDYLINWYVGDELKFTSGKGTLFTYQQTHPMTGNSSIMVTEGLYTPVIQEVELNGFIFSKTGGTGHIPANLTCFDGQEVFVTGFTCDNGGVSSDLPQYEHKITFQGQSSSGVIPPTASASYKLSADTKFFAWKFKGESIYDTIKLSLISSNYSVPIVLEYWRIGANAGFPNFNLNLFPKIYGSSDYLNKVTCLTGLTISTGDYIQIDVTPNPTNTQTNWTLYMDCLQDFNCSSCTTPLPYKIKQSSITGVTQSCNKINISFLISGGCEPSTGYLTNDYYKYLNTSDFSNLYHYTNQESRSLYWVNNQCSVGPWENLTAYQCSTPTTNTITYEKTPGNFRITCSNFNDLLFFKNNYNTVVPPYITPNSGDCTNVEYYRYFTLSFPNSVGSEQCGDGTTYQTLIFHISSNVTTGTTGGDYYINYTMPTMQNCTTYNPCDINCTTYSEGVVNGINDYSSGTTRNYLGTSNTGAKYTNPIHQLVVFSISSSPSTQAIRTGSVRINDFQNITCPASANTPTTYTLLYDNSGLTCNNLSNFWGYTYNDNVLSNPTTFLHYYVIKLIDPSDLTAFLIETWTFSSNGEWSFPIVPVYVFSGGTVQYTDPTYLF